MRNPLSTDSHNQEGAENERTAHKAAGLCLVASPVDENQQGLLGIRFPGRGILRRVGQISHQVSFYLNTSKKIL